MPGKEEKDLLISVGICSNFFTNGFNSGEKKAVDDDYDSIVFLLKVVVEIKNVIVVLVRTTVRRTTSPKHNLLATSDFLGETGKSTT